MTTEVFTTSAPMPLARGRSKHPDGWPAMDREPEREVIVELPIVEHGKETGRFEHYGPTTLDVAHFLIWCRLQRIRP